MHNISINRFKLLFTHEWFELTNEIVGVELPGLGLSYFNIDISGGISVKSMGDEIEYGELVTTVVLDEELQVMYDLQEFLFELKDPITGNYEDKSIPCVLQLYSGASGKVVREIEFINLRPANFSGVGLETNTEDVEFRTIEITWICDRWRMLKKEVL